MSVCGTADSNAGLSSQGCPTWHPVSVSTWIQARHCLSGSTPLPKSVGSTFNSFPPLGIMWELVVSSQTLHPAQGWEVGVVLMRESMKCHTFPTKPPHGRLPASLGCRNLWTSFRISTDLFCQFVVLHFCPPWRKENLELPILPSCWCHLSSPNLILFLRAAHNSLSDGHLCSFQFLAITKPQRMIL